MDKNPRSTLKKCRRVLIKIGSKALNTGKGLNNRVIDRLCDDLSLLRDQGKEFALVSSGAIAEGTAIMRVKGNSVTLSKKQALAAIGQGSLIRAYTDAFRRYGYTAAQILITREDLDDRLRYLNIRNTFTALFEYDAIPIINENDTVSVEEIKFTDNDMLAAMIIPLVEPQALIVLTDTNGVYREDPRVNPNAEIIREIKDIRSEDVKAHSCEAGSMGRGGMQSKIKAAYHASLLGIPRRIRLCSPGGGPVPEGKDRHLACIRAKGKSRRETTDQLRDETKGRVVVDRGAAAMILGQGKSLLPCGVVRVEGNFQAGDPVEIVEEDVKAIAVGLSNFTTEDTLKIKGATTKEVFRIMGHECDEEVVHRNNMIVKKELLS